MGHTYESLLGSRCNELVTRNNLKDGLKLVCESYNKVGDGARLELLENKEGDEELTVSISYVLEDGGLLEDEVRFGVEILTAEELVELDVLEMDDEDKLDDEYLCLLQPLMVIRNGSDDTIKKAEELGEKYYAWVEENVDVYSAFYEMDEENDCFVIAVWSLEKLEGDSFMSLFDLIDNHLVAFHGEDGIFKNFEMLAKKSGVFLSE